jgi:hypothetical protein
MKNLTLNELELLDGALNTYRETLEARKDFDTLAELEELQNSIREEWRTIKEAKAWEEYRAYIAKEYQIPTIKEYFNI